MATFQERFKYALDFRNMTAAETSRLSGVSESLISNYLRGAFNPKADKIDLLARALNVNQAWLMGYDIHSQWDTYENAVFADELKDSTISSSKMSVLPTADPVLAELISIYDKLSTIDRSKLLIMASEMLDK